LLFIKNSITHNPFQTIQIIKHKILCKFKILLSSGSICNAFNLLSLKRKKITNRFFIQSIKLYKQKVKLFVKQVKHINPNNIIAIDECAIYQNKICQYGRTTHKRLIHFSKSRQPKKQSLLMAVSNNQIVAYKLYDTAVNTVLFNDFLKTYIINKYKNKYLLMDNVPFHKSHIITETVNKSNNNLLFIPPYSPQLNPIEEVFSKIKHTFSSLNINPNKNFLNKVIKSINSITSDNLCSYFNHSFN
jgi:transposase